MGFYVFFQQMGIGDIIIIKKKQNSAVRCQDPGVFRGRYAGILDMQILQLHSRRKIPTHFWRGIFRTVIDYNHFVPMLGQSLTGEAFQRLAE